MPTKNKKSVSSAKNKQNQKKKAKHLSSEKTQTDLDIINLILKDHAPLKRLIKIMKNADKEFSERHAAFEEFYPLLIAHAKSEEQVLYTHLKNEEELRTEALEGDVEHELADQMVEEALGSNDEDLWSAKVKVLAELVEHHIEEEEDELLPDFKKASDKELREELGQDYLAVKENINENRTEKNLVLWPREKTLPQH